MPAVGGAATAAPPDSRHKKGAQPLPAAAGAQAGRRDQHRQPKGRQRRAQHTPMMCATPDRPPPPPEKGPTLSVNMDHPEIVRISTKAIPADVVAALRFRSVRESSGYLAALESASASRLAAKFDIGRCLGIVVTRILADHVPILPHERRYQESRERVLNMRRHGQITGEAQARRLTRIQRTKDKSAAAWHAYDEREARARYKKLTETEKVRQRLHFRGHRPRT